MKFNFLNGTDGEQSSKRLFTFILVLLWVMYVIANLFWGKTLKQTLEDNLFYLILFTFFGVAAEGWKNIFIKGNVSKTTETTETKVEVKKEEPKTD